MHEEWSYNSRVQHARRDGCLHAWQLTKGVKSYMRFCVPKPDGSPAGLQIKVHELLLPIHLGLPSVRTGHHATS